jgi:trigger factor
LKIETQPRDDHQVTMVVTLETEQMEGAKRRAARKISERKSVPGFRPGKAPYDVIVRTFGESAIVEEAVDLLLDEVYPKALEESKVEPAAPGSLEKVDDLDKKPKFTFAVPLAPTVELGRYRSIRVPYDWKEPDEKKVEEALQELRQMYAKTETVDRPIEKGDFALVDIKGTGGKAAEGGAPAIERTGFPVFVRADDKPDEFPFPGFSKDLIGLSAGSNKTFGHKFPKDHADENLQGETVEFQVTVKMVRGSTLPELDDEFAKQAGPFENLQALRDTLKANITSQSKAEYDDEYFVKVMEKVKGGATIAYAPQTLDHELEHVMEDIKSRLAQQGLDLPAYLKSRDMDEAKFIETEARPAAIKRLERSLLMDEIAKTEKIEISQETLNASFQQTWGEMSGTQGFQKYVNGKAQPPKQLMNAVAMESANRAYVQLTLERLKAIANGELKDTGAESASKPAKKTASKASAAKSPKGEKPTAKANLKTTKPAASSPKGKKPAASKK